MATLETRQRDDPARWPRRAPPPRWPWMVGLLLGLACVLILLALVNALLRLT